MHNVSQIFLPTWPIQRQVDKTWSLSQDSLLELDMSTEWIILKQEWKV